MVLDSSALVALVVRAPGHDRLVEAVAGAATLAAGTPALLEAAIVLQALVGPQGPALLELLTRHLGLVAVEFTDRHRHEALAAWQRHGKSWHRAQLDFGDCCSYAVARVAGRPLLAADDRFATTDLSCA